jgi:hypothetical protein
MPRQKQPETTTDTRETLTVKLTPEEKKRLARAVMRRKLADPSIPVRWGLSDYAREVLLLHLETVPDE